MNPKPVRRLVFAARCVALTVTVTAAVALALSVSPTPVRPAALPAIVVPTTAPSAAPRTVPFAGIAPMAAVELPDGRVAEIPHDTDGRSELKARTRVAADSAPANSTDLLRAGFERLPNSACTSFDGDGNAVAEWIGCDHNGDGYAEVQAWDLDQNGAFEWLQSPAGGVVGGMILGHDIDGDGRVEHLIADTDGNSRSEAQFFDENRDGVMDWFMLDRFWSDGLADTWVRAGSPQAQRANEQRAVEHIATMDALRSLCRAQRLC